MPKLTFDKGRFTLKCSFEERHLAKDAGMRWDSDLRQWFTTDLAVAARLRVHADEKAKKPLSESQIRVTPWTAPLSPTPPGLELMPHQIEAIRFALSRSSSYLALDPGLGKTPVAARIADFASGCGTVYISPPFLLRNVEEEFKRWAPNLIVKIFHPKSPIEYCETLIVPDSMLNRPEMATTLGNLVWHQIIIDEAHRFKNPHAQRTKALLGAGKQKGLIHQFERKVFMSGTPMPNRPIELFPVLAKAAPETIDYMDWFQFGMRYCAGRRDFRGWDFTGASNMGELAAKVIHPSGPFMLRFKKELLKLPPKVEEVFVLSDDMPSRVATMDKGLADSLETKDGDDIAARLAKAAGKDTTDLHLASYRRLLGEEKAKAIIPYIRDVLDETTDAVLIYAYHQGAVAILVDALSEHRPFVITGATPMEARHSQVKAFQERDSSRVFIGNYLAMGVGFTLTKATRCIFVEFDWVPGVNDQASDRLHRIGQDRSVLVQYVAYSNSIDKVVIEALLRKRKAIKYV